ncbi:MAG: molybdopterin-guanine dinucleotide biosynthesis protein B [Deltaproteobacteria bacterium]|nr:molybdopterin-guanine dinucleotide biosynthesis protein B [Deltaproteobacteria bacterium]
MRLLCLIGRAGSGKTTLVCELLEALRERGLEVGSIKHSPHEHELDRRGKDSFLHRQAGARPAGVWTPRLAAVFVPLEGEGDGREAFDRLAPLYADCDLVLVEGHQDAPGCKLEVYRRAVGEPPLAASRDDIQAVISDDEVEGVRVPVWPRSDIDGLCERLLDAVDAKR